MKFSLIAIYFLFWASSFVRAETEFENFVLQDTHKVVLQGNYFEQDTLNEEESFNYSFKYDGSYLFSIPGLDWPTWDVFFRPWFVASSSEEISDSFSSGQQFEGVYLEAREFYVRKNRLFDLPSVSLTVGRQQYSDYYGIWWDDSIESVKFEFDKTLYGGFLALGQQFYNYNTDTNELNNDQKDVTYLFGELWFLTGPSIRSGIRAFGQYDHSYDHDLEVSDFKGVKLGYFFDAHSQINDEHELFFYSDFSLINGEYQHINSGSSFINADQSVQGWAFVSEIYDQFRIDRHRFKVGVRIGMTDSPENPFSGHALSPVQTDRVSKTGQYSTGLSGTMVNNNLSNIRFLGVMAEYQLDDRSHIEFLAFDMEKRNAELDLAVSIGDAYANGDGKSIGQSYEVFYFTELFPKRVRGRELGIDLLLSAGFFNGGDAIQGSPDDYRVSVGLNATF